MRQTRCIVGLDAVTGKGPGRRRSHGREPISRPGEHGNRHQMEYLLPVVPELEVPQIIGAHQPDEVHSAKPAAKIAERIHGIGAPQGSLESGDLDAGIGCQCLCLGEPVAELRQFVPRLERVPRGHQPPQPVEPEPGQRLVAQDGDLWRWDGYSVTAGTETAAGARLMERSRLAPEILGTLGPGPPSERAIAAASGRPWHKHP